MQVCMFCIAHRCIYASVYARTVLQEGRDEGRERKVLTHGCALVASTCVQVFSCAVSRRGRDSGLCKNLGSAV